MSMLGSHLNLYSRSCAAFESFFSGCCAGEDGSMDCVKVIDGVEMVASACRKFGRKLYL